MLREVEMPKQNKRSRKRHPKPKDQNDRAKYYKNIKNKKVDSTYSYGPYDERKLRRVSDDGTNSINADNNLSSGGKGPVDEKTKYSFMKWLTGVSIFIGILVGIKTLSGPIKSMIVQLVENRSDIKHLSSDYEGFKKDVNDNFDKLDENIDKVYVGLKNDISDLEKKNTEDINNINNRIDKITDKKKR